MGATRGLGSGECCLLRVSKVIPLPHRVRIANLIACSLEQQFASGANNLQPSEGYNSALPEPYEPYPDFRSTEYLRKHSGNYVPCMGPRGLRLNESPQDNVLAHTGFPAGLNIYAPSAVHFAYS